VKTRRYSEAQIYGTDVNGTVIVSTDGEAYVLKAEK